tara:strand:- start:7649 stop:7912 length:264 start_codon:yes stop_codon:yes gene_type:complete
MLSELTDVETLSPFERAQLNIDEMCAGFALCQVISDLIEKSEECKAGLRDLELPREVRAEALKESRLVNQQLALIASLNEIQFGISC